jgi:hypothetical protein
LPQINADLIKNQFFKLNLKIIILKSAPICGPKNKNRTQIYADLQDKK